MPEIRHDGPLDIAVGTSRKDMTWRQTETQWSTLVAKLEHTQRTKETVAEYHHLPKTKQANIKDVGGYIGGYLRGGRRVAGSLIHRQLITLDIDHAKSVADIWESLVMIRDCAALLYTTHAHTPEAPRMRLLIPLDRPVPPDEYEAIARRVAGELNIELFDATTFELNRLMYWPSTSADGEYLCLIQDGEWLSADEVLASYVDWRDTAAWPISERVAKTVRRDIKKQGDPIEKQGLVGSFCRTFTISEAIDTYLSDVYTICDAASGRYTFVGGSTAGGLVVYDDKFAFSHHGTDPCSGQLCNAFDLVRLHKFGAEDGDRDASDHTNITKLASYRLMCELCTESQAVRRQIGLDKLAVAGADFGGTVGAGGTGGLDDDRLAELGTVDAKGRMTLPMRAADTDVGVGDGVSGGDGSTDEKLISWDWLGDMAVDKKGNYLPTIDNVVIVLENDPKLKGALMFDEFAKREVVRHDLPWRKITRGVDDTLLQSDDACLRHYFEKIYNISGRFIIKDGMDAVIQKNSVHPVKEYLDASHKSWDGVERLDTLLIDYLGADDTPYVRAVTRKALTAAAARIYRPGVKFDNILTLIGEQGIGKSQILHRLGGGWFSDSFSGLGTKEAFEQIQGKWIIEFGELAGLKKAEVETIKHFVSKTDDYYRAPYTQRTVNFKRQCVFVATTNDYQGFLQDRTGNRRWWPVATDITRATKHIFTDLTASELMHIWGEAVDAYKSGESLYLKGSVAIDAEEVQDANVEEDIRFERLEEYLLLDVPENWYSLPVYEQLEFVNNWLNNTPQNNDLGDNPFKRTRITAREVWTELCRERISNISRFDTKNIFNHLRKVKGWVQTKKTIRVGEIVGKGFIKINN